MIGVSPFLAGSFYSALPDTDFTASSALDKSLITACVSLAMVLIRHAAHGRLHFCLCGDCRFHAWGQGAQQTMQLLGADGVGVIVQNACNWGAIHSGL